MVFDRKKYKEFAQIQLNKRRGLPAVITLITLVVVFLVNLPIQIRVMSTYSEFFMDILDDPEYFTSLDFLEMLEYYNSFAHPVSLFLTYGLALLESVIGVIFAFASYNFYFAMSRSPEPIKFGTYIEGFNNWGRAIVAMLWKGLWLILWGLLSLVIYFAACMILGLVAGFLISDFESTIAIILVLIFPILFASMIPLIYKAVTYSMMYFICAEFKNVSVITALNISKKLCKGRFWNLMGVWFSFFGWFILNALSRSLLSLWLTPYYTLTQINVYHALLKDALETGTVTPEELGQSSFQQEEKIAGPSSENTDAETSDENKASDAEKETSGDDDTDETLKEFFDEKTETNQEEKSND